MELIPKIYLKWLKHWNAKQIPFEYNEAGDSILVPEDKRAEMRMNYQKGLPKTGDVGFEIFDEGNFGISDLSKELIILVLFKVNCIVPFQ